MARTSLRHLTKRYGSLVTVDDVTVEIGQGEFVAFVGPSGCGKTTTLRMIAGLTEASGGSVLFDGRDVTQLPSNRRNTGIVFQGYALFPHMTVAENVAFGLEMRGVGAADRTTRVSEALALVRLDRFAARYPRELSGGQQQRVALARAVVIRPDVLLLDEPLSALDAQLRGELRGEIRRLQRELKLTTVFVTHDQEEAVSMADRIVIMNGGRVEQVGTPEEVYEHPATPFVAGFVGLSNMLPGSVESPGLFRTAGGVTLAFSVDRPTGAATHLVVRPEKVELGAGAPPGTPAGNAASGVVEGVTYLGPVTEVVVRLPGGERITAPRQNRAAGDLRLFRPGDAATVSWPASASFVL